MDVDTCTIKYNIGDNWKNKILCINYVVRFIQLRRINWNNFVFTGERTWSKKHAGPYSKSYDGGSIVDSSDSYDQRRYPLSHAIAFSSQTEETWDNYCWSNGCDYWSTSIPKVLLTINIISICDIDVVVQLQCLNLNIIQVKRIPAKYSEFPR